MLERKGNCLGQNSRLFYSFGVGPSLRILGRTFELKKKEIFEIQRGM
jgi:hypothetical protein